MATTYSDTFAGSGALGVTEVGGLAWFAIVGSGSRNSGKLVFTTDSGFAVVDPNSANVDISATVSGTDDAIYFRVVDESNWWRLVGAETEWTEKVYYDIMDVTYGHPAHHGYLQSTSPDYVRREQHGRDNGQIDPPTSSSVSVTHSHDGQSYTISYPYKSYTLVSSGSYDQTVNGYRVYVEQMAGGAFRRIGTYNLYGKPSSLRVRARANVLTFFADGSQVGTVTDATLQSATKHGLGRGQVSATTGQPSNLDNFSLTLIEPPAPTVNSPSANSALTSNRPTVTATRGSYDVNTKFEWQFAHDSAFTTGVKTVVEDNSAMKLSGSSSVTLTAEQALSQRGWFVRVRAVDVNGTSGPWSSSIPFTISHIPGAINLRPTGGAGLLHGATSRFSWQFTDPYQFDTQSAYHLVIERNDTGALVFDSGKINSANQYHDYSIPVELRDIQLRWKLRVWDAENVESSFTGYQLFTPSLAPNVTITQPVGGGTVTSGAPVTTWTFAATIGRTQAAHRLTIRRQDTGAFVYDSGTITSQANLHAPTTSVLKSDIVYIFRVDVTDSSGLPGFDEVIVTATYVAPEPVDFAAYSNEYESNGYVRITWSAQADAAFLFWRLYRREAGVSDWSIVTEIPESSITEYRDWIVPSQTNQEYQIVQVVERFGEQVESAVSQTTEVYVEPGGYWLIDPVNTENSARIHNVISETYKKNRERAEVVVVGRGRHVDVGENIGISGTLTGQLRDSATGTARQKKIKLEQLIDSGVSVYLRNPFGDLTLVSLGDMDVARVAGVGPSEFVDVTIPYSEVF